MKVLIAAGGTGGHFYPAIALGEAFQSEGISVIFVGRKGSSEEQKYSEYGFYVRSIHASQFDLTPRKVFLFAINFVKGIFNAFYVLKKEQVDAVIGGGGYVSAPVLFAALVVHVPYFLYEQNIVPGRTNRIFKRFARNVFLGFNDEYNFFGNKSVFTGNPIRKKMTLLNRKQALSALDLKDIPTLIVFGGSGGSNKINEIFSLALPEIVSRINIQVLFITGDRMYNEITKKIHFPNTRVVKYLEDIHIAYSLADFAITRAGAMTLTELAYFKIPAITIPFPFARDDHQKKNAMYLAERGCIEVIDEKTLTKDLILEKIIYYFTHMDIIMMMKMSFEGIFPKNSAELIVKEVRSSLNE